MCIYGATDDLDQKSAFFFKIGTIFFPYIKYGIILFILSIADSTVTGCELNTPPPA